MEPKDIHITDLQRILFGEVPPGFLIEVVIRITVILLLLVVAMRIMGKRMSSQLSIQEMAVLVSLAAAVGIPMQDPSRGLLPAVLVVVIAIAIQLILAKGSFKNRKVELITQGDATAIIQDGVLHLENIKKNSLTREVIFAQARYDSIRQLGQISRLYMEASGAFTLIQAHEEKPGLSLIPEEDQELRYKQVVDKNFFSCNYCGFTVPEKTIPAFSCSNCDTHEWRPSIQIKSIKEEIQNKDYEEVHEHQEGYFS